MLKRNSVGGMLAALFVLAAMTEVQAQSSGLLLGIYYTEAQGSGLYVKNTIDGYSADGQLQRGDVLLRVANERGRIYSVDSGRDLENTKEIIGSNTPVDIQILRRYRNGSREYKYFRVVFQPVRGLPASERPRGVTGSAAVATFAGSDGSFFNRRSSGGASGSFFNRR